MDASLPSGRSSGTTVLRTAQAYAGIWTLVWALGLALEVFFSVRLADGLLVYSLDDPYIHLAVAETVLEGGYGVNLGEFSSPSSSILYPLLLAAVEPLGLGPAAPLLLNALACGLSVWLLLEFLWRRAVPEGESLATVFPHLLAAPLILSINALALPMTGMEHCLHVLAVVVTLRGLVEVAEGRAVSPWLGLAIVCLPLLRFEGLALAGAALLALLVAGRRRAAVALGALLLLCLVSFGVAMTAMGLPLLPSSVLLKSALLGAGSDGGIAGALGGTARRALFSLADQRWALLLGLGTCALLAALQDRAGRWRAPGSPEVVIAGVMALALAAHLLAGHYGWFYRYEVYAVAILVTGGIYLLRGPLRALQARRLVAAQLALVAGLAILALPYAVATWKTPLAARNIYEQQYQMHRFATEFLPRPVAVNDLGWVSYRNDAFVLDLWGLGSEPVRRLRVAGALDAESIAGLVERAGVDYAMIYRSWFADSIPESWCLMAVLEGERVIAASGQAYFYAARPSVEAEMAEALARFAPTLPARVTLKRLQCDG